MSVLNRIFVHLAKGYGAPVLRRALAGESPYVGRSPRASKTWPYNA
jgi:hypothetical protein